MITARQRAPRSRNPNAHAIIHKLLAAVKVVEQRTEFAGTRKRSVIHSINKKKKCPVSLPNLSGFVPRGTRKVFPSCDVD